MGVGDRERREDLLFLYFFKLFTDIGFSCITQLPNVTLTHLSVSFCPACPAFASPHSKYLLQWLYRNISRY